MLQDARPPRLRKGFNAEYGGDSAKWTSHPNGWWISLATGVWHARDCRILWAEGLFVTGARGLGLAGARERRFGDSDSVRGRGKLISEYLHGRDGEDGPGKFEAIIRCDVIIGEQRSHRARCCWCPHRRVGCLDPSIGSSGSCLDG